MAVTYRIQDPTKAPQGGVLSALYTEPGLEAGYVNHTSQCPLRKVMLRGVRMPFCPPECGAPSPPVYTVSILAGRVVHQEGQQIIVWTGGKSFREWTPPNDPAWPTRVVVDAPQAAVDEWLFCNLQLEVLAEEEQRRQEELVLQEQIKHEEEELARVRERQAKDEAILASHLAVAEQKAKLEAAKIKSGNTVQIVADPPSFAKMKKRDRERQSRIGQRGLVNFVDLTDRSAPVQLLVQGQTVLVVRSLIRKVNADGSLCEEDLS